MGASLHQCGSRSLFRWNQRKCDVVAKDSSDEEFVLSGVKGLDQKGPITFHQRYELTRKLGQGSFATVYSVLDAQKDSSDGELIAKVLDLKRSSLRREIRILLKVSQIKYCVKLVDYFLEGEFAYLVMERCDVEFYDLLRSNKKLTERSFVPFARDIFEALAAIHELRIIHRDVKPDNFLFSRRCGVLKLCDFGMSACLTPKKPFAVGVSGTAPFMSPEMLAPGGGPYGVTTDIWSVGVLMYVILLGEFPYMPAKPDANLMKNMIVAGLPVPSFRSGSPGVRSPSAMSIDLLHKSIDRNPLNRVTAIEALNHAWLILSETSDHSSHDIMPAIHSARRAGAFSFRHIAPFDDIDPCLKMLQEVSKGSRALLAKQENELAFCEVKSVESTAAGSQCGEPAESGQSHMSARSSNEHKIQTSVVCI